jgi:hypothetical protein
MRIGNIHLRQIDVVGHRLGRRLLGAIGLVAGIGLGFRLARGILMGWRAGGRLGFALGAVAGIGLLRAAILVAELEDRPKHRHG